MSRLGILLSVVLLLMLSWCCFCGGDGGGGIVDVVVEVVVKELCVLRPGLETAAHPIVARRVSQIVCV